MISKVNRHKLIAIEDEEKMCILCGGISRFHSEDPEGLTRKTRLVNGLCEQCERAESFRIKNLRDEITYEDA